MRNKYVASILALCIGIFGVHRFYLNQRFLGFLYILLFPISPIISFIDAILFLTADQQEFDYQHNKRFFSDIYGITPYQYVSNKKLGARDSYIELNKLNHSKEQDPIFLKIEKKLKKGEKALDAYDLDKAINIFSEILTIDPSVKEAHFFLACAYSLLENKRNALYHLQIAIDLGVDHNIIEEEDELAFVRMSPEYLVLCKEGFPKTEKPKEEPKKTLEDIFITKKTPPKIKETKTNQDFLDNLERLAELRKAGVLTTEEFEIQKKRLLNH